MTKIRKEYFTEDELVEKMQNNEIGWLEYVTQHSPEWDAEFEEFLKEKELEANNDSAEAFLQFKEEQMEKGFDEGNV